MGLGVKRRAKNQARVVITLEVELSPEYMQALPAYQRDAVNALRNIVIHNRMMHDDVSSLIHEIDRNDGINVTDIDVSVAH